MFDDLSAKTFAFPNIVLFWPLLIEFISPTITLFKPVSLFPLPENLLFIPIKLFMSPCPIFDVPIIVLLFPKIWFDVSTDGWITAYADCEDLLNYVECVVVSVLGLVVVVWMTGV